MECWWCSAPLLEHGASEYGKLNIGFLCDHEKWMREQMPPRSNGRRGAKPTLNMFDSF